MYDGSGQHAGGEHQQAAAAKPGPAGCGSRCATSGRGPERRFLDTDIDAARSARRNPPQPGQVRCCYGTASPRSDAPSARSRRPLARCAAEPAVRRRRRRSAAGAVQPSSSARNPGNVRLSSSSSSIGALVGFGKDDSYADRRRRSVGPSPSSKARKQTGIPRTPHNRVLHIIPLMWSTA